MAMQWFAGLMTGTVLDGQIDIALLRTDGQQVAEFGAYDLIPYSQEVCTILQECLDEARVWNFNGPDPAIFQRAERALTLATEHGLPGDHHFYITFKTPLAN